MLEFINDNMLIIVFGLWAVIILFDPGYQSDDMLPLPPNTCNHTEAGYPDHDIYERKRLGKFYARAKVWELRINDEINTNALVNNARVDRWPDDHLFYVAVDSFFEGGWVPVHVSHVELDSVYPMAVRRWAN
jgi:hypothetical protein